MADAFARFQQDELVAPPSCPEGVNHRGFQS